MENISRFWFFAHGGSVVAGNVSVESLDAARAMAARWNRDETRDSLRVEVIANGPIAAQASRVTTVAL